MGTCIQKYTLSAGDFGGEHLRGCNDCLVLTRPDIIREIHASYLAVGCDVIETDTFRANRLALAEYGLSDPGREINRAGAALAKEVASSSGGRRAGPAWWPEPGTHRNCCLLHLTRLCPLSLFRNWPKSLPSRPEALAAGGADLLLLETQQDILEVKAAVYGINRFSERAGRRLPLQVQVTLDTTGRMLLGTTLPRSQPSWRRCRWRSSA